MLGGRWQGEVMPAFSAVWPSPHSCSQNKKTSSIHGLSPWPQSLASILGLSPWPQSLVSVQSHRSSPRSHQRFHQLIGPRAIRMLRNAITYDRLLQARAMTKPSNIMPQRMLGLPPSHASLKPPNHALSMLGPPNHAFVDPWTEPPNHALSMLGLNLQIMPCRSLDCIHVRS